MGSLPPSSITMEASKECETAIGEKNSSSLKPFSRDDDDHHTVSTFNDSTLDQGDQSGNDSSNSDLPLVQRIGSTLSENSESSLSLVSGHLMTPPYNLQPAPWHSVATKAILQKLNSEYQRQRIRLGELRSRSDYALAGTNWQRNLHAKDFKFRILVRRIAELQARNQDLMKQQVDQGVLQQKLEAAQRQIRILQSAWNQTLDLHMAGLDVSDDSFPWQPLLPPSAQYAPHGKQRHVKHQHQASANSAASPPVMEISHIWKQDATAKVIPTSSQMSDDSCTPPTQGRADASSLEEPGNDQHNTQLQQANDTFEVKVALKSSEFIPDPNQEQQDMTTQLQEEVKSLHMASAAQKVEMAKMCYGFLQDKARHERQYANLQETHQHVVSQIQQLQSENNQLVEDKQLMKTSLGQYQLSISTLCKKQSNLFLELEEKTIRLDDAEQEIERLERLVEQQGQDSLSLQDQLTAQQQQALMDIAHLKECNENLSIQNQTLEKSLSQTSQQVSQLESVIVQLQARLQQAEESKSCFKAENARLARECQENKKKLQILQKKKHDADCISEVHASIFGFW